MLIGMELFSYKLDDKLYEENREYGTFHRSYVHKSTFNTLLEAFLSTFIVLANDGWTRIYFEHYRSTNAIAATFYFFTIIVVGQFILMNLFISVLIENFEQLSIRKDLVQRLSDLRKTSLIQRIAEILTCKKHEKDDNSKYIDKMLDEEAIK
jgi:hypothetical protein